MSRNLNEWTKTINHELDLSQVQVKISFEHNGEIIKKQMLMPLKMFSRILMSQDSLVNLLYNYNTQGDMHKYIAEPKPFFHLDEITLIQTDQKQGLDDEEIMILVNEYNIKFPDTNTIYSNVALVN